jgi:hypothetical protein
VSTIRNLVAAGIALVLLSGCQRSADQLVNAVDDKPGVIDVEVYDNGGEADLPFSSLPWIVNVTMKETSSRKQIKDVAHAYEEDMADREVESVTIKIGDRGTLELGETTGDTDPWADALAYGLEDRRVSGIHVSAWTPGPSVEISLASADFATVKKYVDHYRRPYRLADLRVVGGAFEFYATENYQAGQQARAAARLLTATAVDERFGLEGAQMQGGRRDPLRLAVGPGPDLAVVRAFAKEHAAPGTGPIVVVRAKVA